MALELTKSEEDLVLAYRAERKATLAYNRGIEYAAQMAEAWSREGGGVLLLDNFADALRLKFQYVKEAL